jgi:hypothetical protein
MKKLIRKYLIIYMLCIIGSELFAQDTSTNHSVTTPLSIGNSGTGGNIDILYHKIYWRINPDSTIKYIKGWVQFSFKTIQVNVAEITFDLRSVLIIDSIRFRGLPLPVANITRTGNIVSVNLGETLDNNVIDSFFVYYRGSPPNVIGLAEGYQRGNVAGQGNYISTFSESYEDRDWWPCKADMQDKIDSMDIIVSVPWGTPTAADTFWVASNGKLIDSTINGTNRIFWFKTRYPIASYLVCVSVAKFNRYYRTANSNGKSVPVVYNLLRGKSSYTSILAAMDNINLVLEAFSKKFGDYPFKLEKHGFYDGIINGAIEHQTFSGIASVSLTSLKTLSQKLAGQWFGSNVSFSTWNDLWLAKGFASYCEALAGELVPSLGINPFNTRAAFKLSALNLSSQSAWIPNNNIITSDLIWGSNYGSTALERGAMVVSMLRAICGDSIFFKTLTNYQTNLAGKSANTDSLKNYFNAALGKDLSGFFNSYVGGSGSGNFASGGIGNPINGVNWNSPSPNKLVVQMGTQTRSAGANVNYFTGPIVLHVKGAIASQDTTITFFDWGAGNLSHAGNGLSNPVPGNRLSYLLSFTPTSVSYDDSARTLSTGFIFNAAGLDNYTWLGTTNTAWNTASNWNALGVPPAGVDITIATTGVNQPILPGNITVGPLTINASKSIFLAGNTLTLNSFVRGSGAFSGSPASTLIVAGNAGVLNFVQTNAGTRSLLNLTINPNCSATVGTGFLDIYGGLNLVNTSNLNVQSARLTLIH